MAIRILGISPELTLIFDRSSVWLSSDQLELLSRTLSEVEGVESVHPRTAWYASPRITVVFDSDTQPNAMLRRMANALRSTGEHAPDGAKSDPLATAKPLIGSTETLCQKSTVTEESELPVSVEHPTEGCLSVRQRLRELSYGILTLGSFGMAWVGLIVPGIPTVPFVLLTAHFALQASPKLRARVVKSRMFGQMIRDWQEHGAVSRHIQIEAYILTLVIIVIGLIFSPPIPIVYAGMAFGSVLGLYAVSQIPVIESTENREAVVKAGGFLKNAAASA